MLGIIFQYLEVVLYLLFINNQNIHVNENIIILIYIFDNQKFQIAKIL